MTQPAKGQEPSMEEILASIRRIIADEEPAKDTTEDTTERRHESLPAGREGAATARETAPRPMTPPPRIAPAAAAAPKTDEEFDAMLAHLRGAPRQAPAASAEPELSEAAPEPAALETQRPAIDERGLLSAATTATVGAAFDTLARTAQVRGGRTVEELVSELLRPMLKTWLDENLPGMVERLVRAEIERVSRGRS